MRTIWMSAAVAAMFLAVPALGAEATDCVLQVDGTEYFNGPCEIDANGDTVVVRGPDVTYFAYVDVAGGISTWNAEAGATHAHDQLGVLEKDGSCWVNDTAKVCFVTP